MATTLSFQIRVIKNQIAACLREIAKGVKYFIDSLVVLEGQLEKQNGCGLFRTAK